MGILRILLKLNNPSQCLTNPNHTISTHLILPISHKSSSLPSIFRRYISLSAQFQHKIDTDSINSNYAVAKNKKPKKPLNLLFKEAVGLSEKLEHSEGESDSENQELKRSLRKLEIEVRNLRENEQKRFKEDNKEEEIKRDNGVLRNELKPRRLYALFSENGGGNKGNLGKEINKRVEEPIVGGGNKRDLGKEINRRVEEPIVYKELSSDVVYFANHLYKEGYFKDANFLPRNKFDATCFENNYGRDFLKYASEKFGRDNQEIAKWLSGSDLKTVALFGCPSLSRKNIFSAKTLRTFFKIQEDTVCSKCVLKKSCKFPNQSVWKGNTKTLDLAVVMRVITLYALDAGPPELVVLDEVKASVSRLLKEILHLSETVS
ncbi:hypothetical protein LguiB_002812 [Lonicera macranthoides]